MWLEQTQLLDRLLGFSRFSAMVNSKIELVFLQSLFLSIFLLMGPAQSYDSCSSLSTCGACIHVPDCVWCSKPTKMTHCQSRNLMTDCPSDLIVDPVASYKILQDNPRFQLRPQKSSLTNLRLGTPYNISLKFKLASDYPLDLYYLMDASNSMYGDRNNLVRLAHSLASTMRNITANFKLGYGSFVDKNVLPFVEKTGPSCGSVEVGCAVTYGFQHQLSLIEDENAFISTVNSTRIVVSYDNPEGGFEALLQASVCDKQIGWSDQSRRLIVFATDAHSHLAGDGRLGGISRPNDGHCHLNPVNNFYTEAEKQDYPSLGQVSRVVADNSINLIFAVTPDVEATYKEFTKLIPASYVGRLGNDSENIVQLIHQIYQEIASSIELKDTAGQGIKLRYFTSCMGQYVQENNKCDRLEVGSTVEFTVSIEVTECPANPAEWKRTIMIYPLGIKEAFILALEMVCDCPCEKPGKPAPECNYGGELRCGICHCDASHTGEYCECSSDSNSIDLETGCKADNTTNVLCSGRGDCICGKCECRRLDDPSQVIDGKYCECDNFSCERVNDQLCSGNGQCNCGKCLCYTGWTGVGCDCRTSDDTCIPIGGGDMCLGNGVCKCGACQCFSNAQGKYCEICPTCTSKCSEFEPCVQCKVFQTGPFMSNNQQECNKQCTYPIAVQDYVQAEQASEHECSYTDEQNCVVKFVYGYDDNGAKRVRVQREPICPQPVPVLAIGLGLLGALLLLGLLLLAGYKISTHLYDKRQYARFLEEQKKAKWNTDVNPLYVAPTQEFRNPNYGNAVELSVRSEETRDA